MLGKREVMGIARSEDEKDRDSPAQCPEIPGIMRSVSSSPLFALLSSKIFLF
jgi:hypothetical protein